MMMARSLVLPYSKYSCTARVLARAIGARRIKHENSRYVPRRNDTIVNWGCSALPFTFGDVAPNFLNHPDLVDIAVSKEKTFVALGGTDISIPLWTTEAERAQRWVEKGKCVLQRDLLRASAGRGLSVVNPDAGVTTRGRMWTLYRKKFDEYRVHVFRGAVIDVQRKARSRSDGRWTGETRIRNTANGWVYVREGVTCPRQVLSASTAAVGEIGLDFAAVDVGFTRESDLATVYELNTAPALTGQTLAAYVGALVQALDRGRVHNQ